MSGDVHVRFCEGPGVKLPGATHQTHFGLPRKNSSMSVSEEIADERPDGDSKSLHFGWQLLRQPRLAQTVEETVEALVLCHRVNLL
jgi:hypothetical protein